MLCQHRNSYKAEFLPNTTGLAPSIAESNPELLENEWRKMEHDLVNSGLEGALRAYDNLMATTARREDPLAEMTALTKSMWQKETEAAEKYNDPDQFTAFIGFEWTSMPNGNNLRAPDPRELG